MDLFKEETNQNLSKSVVIKIDEDVENIIE